MSRPMLYATLAVLFALLIGTSYAMRKVTQPEAPPQAEMPPAKQAEMMESRRAEMMASEKKKREMMQLQSERQRDLDKKKAEKLAALGVKRTSTAVDISDKWFKQSQDGPAGIQQAIREKEIIEKVDKSMPALPPPTSVPAKPMPSAASTTK